MRCEDRTQAAVPRPALPVEDIPVLARRLLEDAGTFRMTNHVRHLGCNTPGPWFRQLPPRLDVRALEAARLEMARPVPGWAPRKILEDGGTGGPSDFRPSPFFLARLPAHPSCEGQRLGSHRGGLPGGRGRLIALAAREGCSAVVLGAASISGLCSGMGVRKEEGTPSSPICGASRSAEMERRVRPSDGTARRGSPRRAGSCSRGRCRPVPAFRTRSTPPRGCSLGP